MTVIDTDTKIKMLKLYGFKTSSYYSMVKLTLLEKQLEFEEMHVPLFDGKLHYDPDYLDQSPIGKVPTLETSDGFLSETSVIIDYLDEEFGQSFYPKSPFERAKVRELIKYVELYLELPARRLYGEFFDHSAADDDKEEVRSLLDTGFEAFTKLARFRPYICGSKITYADFFAVFALTSVTRTTKAIYGWDTFNTVPGVRRMIETISRRDAMKQLMSERSS